MYLLLWPETYTGTLAGRAGAGAATAASTSGTWREDVCQLSSSPWAMGRLHGADLPIVMSSCFDLT